MVIETLYILYKAITTDLTKGNEDVKKSTKSVGAEVTAVDKQTQELGKQFKKLAVEIAGVLGVAFTTGEFFRTLKDASDFGRSLGVTSNLLGVNTRELQAWGQVLEHVGGSAEGFQSDLQAIGNYFGVTAAEAIKFLPLLGQAFEKLNPIQANLLGQNYGISLPMIQLLREGNSEIAKQLGLQVKLGLLTQDDADKFVVFNDAVLDSKNALRGLALSVVTDALPSLDKVFEFFTTSLVYLREHKDELGDALKGIGIGIAAALAIANPEITLFVAGLTALIAAQEKLKAFHDSLQTAGDSSFGFFRSGLGDLSNDNLSLNVKGVNIDELAKKSYDFNALINSPIATQAPGSISNSSRTNNYNHNVNIGTVQTPDAKSFARKDSFSPEWHRQNDYQQANGSAMSGAQ